ncbi:hypothetical protein FRC10_002542 [Ceratobasidium sp. 414]|nr:hypothetical protein FRC10_002542 [Ceratobasidium sp. 414]
MANQSFAPTRSQTAYENVMQNIQDNLSYIGAVETHVHESRAVLDRLLDSSDTRVPIDKLPPETLGHIFSIIVATSPCYITYRQRGVLLDIPQVCARWHQVATNTPSLWSHVDINLFFLPVADSLKVWLGRCRNLPIHLHFQNCCSVRPREVISDLVSLLRPHAASLGSLIISNTVAYPLIHDLYDILSSSSTSNSLKTLVLSRIYWVHGANNAVRWPINALHGLTELELYHIEDLTCFTLGETVAILSHCSALHTLRLNCVGITPSESQDFPTIFLPDLKLLEFRTVYEDEDEDGDGLPVLLSLLSPGVLELDVRLDSYHISEDEMAPSTQLFLARSNVVSLSVNPTGSGQVERYRSYFSVIPRLRALLLSGPQIGQVMAGLNGSKLQLPHLRSLCLTDTYLPHKVISTLGQVIAARRLHRLVFLSCKFPRTFVQPEEDVPFDDGEWYYCMPLGMMEWLSERVEKVVVGEKPESDQVYHGMDPLVQELIRLD